MGDFSDLVEDALSAQDAIDAEDQLRAALGSDAKWTMKDGTKIRVCEMSTGHVRNTIAMLKRKEAALDEFHPVQFRRWMDLFESELEKRSADKR